MNLSGILVVSTEAAFDALIENLNQLPDLEVHHIDRESHRLIVVQEAGNVHDEVTGLKRIKKLPGVVLAEMVTHYFGDDSNNAAQTLPDELLSEADTTQFDLESAVPAYLND